MSSQANPSQNVYTGWVVVQLSRGCFRTQSDTSSTKARGYLASPVRAYATARGRTQAKRYIPATHSMSPAGSHSQSMSPE